MPDSRKGALALYLLFGAALFWALASHFHPGSSWHALTTFDHEYTAGVVGLVLINLAIRFMRWQFLLRKIGVRVPTRASLGIFLATLSLIITPLYIGELLKPYLIKKRVGAQMRRTLAVVAMERYLDALALVALALLDLDGLRRIGPWAALPVALAVPLVAAALSPRLRVAIVRLFSRLRFFVSVAEPLRPSGEALAALNRGTTLLQAFAASLVAWAAAAASLALVLHGFGVDALSPLGAIGAFASATLAGAATLLPGGIGPMELTLAARLNAVTTAETAWSVVFLLRLLTLWFGVALGAIVLLAGHRAWLRREPDAPQAHFGDLAPVYDAQIAPHMREHYLAKKVDRMQRVLASRGITAGRGADIGCGTGWYAAALERNGHTIVGLDREVRQLAQFADRTGAPGVVGDASALPWADGSFDFAYAINIVHHLPSRDAQRAAFAEVARVLRPGGVFFLHEINVTNPLYRLYMVFLFPVLKDIDEGTEHWIAPDEDALVRPLTRRAVDYFTFLPDFTPRFALRALAGIERRLERGRLRRGSAHYMMVLEKEDAR